MKTSSPISRGSRSSKMASSTVTPATQLGAEAPNVPGDKSISHRAVIFAAMAEGESLVTNVAPGEDVASSMRCVAQLGASVERSNGSVKIRGGAWRTPAEALDCGNSGTTMRLLMGALAGRGIAAVLDGDESLRRRPMKRIAEPLHELGAEIETSAGNAPVRVSGNKPLHGGTIALRVASAQLASSLTLAATGASGRTTITGAGSARDHTTKMLPHFGVAVRREGDAIVVDGPQRFHAADFRVPGDPSAAAFWLAAAAIVPHSTITVRNVNLNPTRLGFVDALVRMGADVTIEVAAEEPEPMGHITLRTAPLHAIAIEEADVPAIVDELPLLGVVAAYAAGTTSVRGARELRVKESDRIAVLATGLRALGGTIAEVDDGFDVTGPSTSLGTGSAPLHGGTVASGGDHRLAMAFAIAALGATSPVTIEDSGCVAISHPSFFSDLDALCRG
jgi:3-phosphoshikimate 1-carboxyvinyltransferase